MFNNILKNSSAVRFQLVTVEVEYSFTRKINNDKVMQCHAKCFCIFI